MSESQYADYKNLPRQQLGLMSGEIWQRDPKMLGIHLARYKFVAKMLSGKGRVAEVGCGDGWYSKIVKEQVGRLNLYDFDPLFAKEADALCLDILNHVITWGAPPSFYDAIYSLDVMEHIHPSNEKTYLLNIRDSLVPEGIFIIGMPSLESQKYASEASKIGHVNCKSGEELKKLLENYFHNVFLFSMHDEVISTAFSPMAHYLMAVCCGVR